MARRQVSSVFSIEEVTEVNLGKPEWEHLASCLLADTASPQTRHTFAPIDLLAKRIGIRYGLDGIEVAELADFIRDRLDRWEPPSDKATSVGDWLQRWCFRVGDNRAKSVVRSIARKRKVALDALSAEELARLEIPRVESTSQVDLISLKQFVKWLASAKGRDEELALLQSRMDGMQVLHHDGPVIIKRTRATAKRLRSLWQAFDAGGPMPNARRRPTRTPSK